MMPRRGKLIEATVGAAALLVLIAAPFQIGTDDLVLVVRASHAVAKDGNNGSGNSGNSGSGPGENSSGNSGSNSGSGPGENSSGIGGSGHGSNSGGGNSGSGNSVNGGGRNNGNTGTGGASVEISGSSIEVLHADGMREAIRRGRYIMFDAKGRRIVERRATESDRARLRALRR